MLTSDTIRILYPEDRFPVEYYPNLISVLTDSFVAQTKSVPQNGGDIHAEFSRTCSLRSLLKNDPGALVLLYSHMIYVFVHRYCFSYDDREDVYQEILTRLLQDKVEKIRINYDFAARGERGFSSYFMAVVRNVFMDMVKHNKTHKERMISDPEMDKRHSSALPVEWTDKTTLQKEFNKIDFILKLLGEKRSRVELLIKLKYRVPLTHEDIHKCFPDCNKDEIAIFMEDYRALKDKQLWEKVEPIIIEQDGKNNQPGALRRWVNLKINEILEILNRSHNNHVYDDGVLEILMHLYYKE